MRRVENSMLFTGLVTDKGRMGLFTRKRVGVGVFVEGSVTGLITKAILIRRRFLGAFFSGGVNPRDATPFSAANNGSDGFDMRTLITLLPVLVMLFAFERAYVFAFENLCL
ncbi:hypothetical protein Hdeb2414_s0008g00295101 [Helianthus debilis subsp. tardiflorus]